ncbi:MAG: hypothetical protein HY553_07775 [Elusimicrobia bacterium]|nr:hypothetical protein [Elusimicrobiota bacterium]
MKKNDSSSLHPKILIGLPDIQDQLRLVDRQAAAASEPELSTWRGLGELLAELYSQMQSTHHVTVHRFAQRSKSKPRGSSEPRRR